MLVRTRQVKKIISSLRNDSTVILLRSSDQRFSITLNMRSMPALETALLLRSIANYTTHTIFCVVEKLAANKTKTGKMLVRFVICILTGHSSKNRTVG